MSRAAAAVSSKFFGLSAESAKPAPPAFAIVNSSIVRIQPGVGVSSPLLGPAPPLPDRRHQEEQAEAEQQHIHPGSGLSFVTRIRDPGEHEHDPTNRSEADTPGKDEG